MTQAYRSGSPSSKLELVRHFVIDTMTEWEIFLQIQRVRQRTRELDLIERVDHRIGNGYHYVVRTYRRRE